MLIRRQDRCDNELGFFEYFFDDCADLIKQPPGNFVEKLVVHCAGEVNWCILDSSCKTVMAYYQFFIFLRNVGLLL